MNKVDRQQLDVSGWEEVDHGATSSDSTYTFRLKVPGGWLYRVEFYTADREHVSVTFVPRRLA